MIELGAFHSFAPRRETGGPPFDENRRLTFAFEGSDAVLVDYQDYELGRGKEARDDSFAGLTGCPRCPSKRMGQAPGR